VRFPRYPAYRPTGAGCVPEHWQVRRLKYVASINDEVLPEWTRPDLELAYVDIGSVDANGNVQPAPVVFEDAPSRARRIVRDGDTIISTVRTYLRAIAPIRAPSDNLVVSTGFAVVRPRTLDPRYLSYVLRERRFVDEVVARSVGVSYPATNPSQLGTIEIPVAPLCDQRAIADFLDARIAKLDRLVVKKRMLIRKLEEKRLALITRSCTSGVAMRASPCDVEPQQQHGRMQVPWVACLPSHWETRKLRYLLAALDQGWSPVAGSTPALEHEWGVLKLSAVRGGRFIPGENKVLDEPPAELAHTPRPGDVLLSRANTPQRVGDACVVREACPRLIIPDLLYRLVTDGKVLPEFLCAFLLSTSGRAQIEADARGSSESMVKLGQEHVRSWIIPLPPLTEQAAIIRHLTAQAGRLDRLIERVRRAIRRLEEYRAALITAAVTGQIDVRGEAP
jgi:type I restriction enzyme S subunit